MSLQLSSTRRTKLDCLLFTTSFAGRCAALLPASFWKKVYKFVLNRASIQIQTVVGDHCVQWFHTKRFLVYENHQECCKRSRQNCWMLVLTEFMNRTNIDIMSPDGLFSLDISHWENEAWRFCQKRVRSNKFYLFAFSKMTLCLKVPVMLYLEFVKTFWEIHNRQSSGSFREIWYESQLSSYATGGSRKWALSRNQKRLLPQKCFYFRRVQNYIIVEIRFRFLYMWQSRVNL